MIKDATADLVSERPVPGLLSEGVVGRQRAALAHFLLVAVIEQGTQHLPDLVRKAGLEPRLCFLAQVLSMFWYQHCDGHSGGSLVICPLSPYHVLGPRYAELWAEGPHIWEPSLRRGLDRCPWE